MSLSVSHNSRSPIKIAFGYKCGAGKDTAVDYLMQKYGGKRISFAGPIYDILRYAQKVCGFEQVKDRQFLQYVGTEWARNKEENVWVRLALESAEGSENAFISDLRFPNEFSALKKDGWICVKLQRERQEERKGTGSHTHASEIALDCLPDSEWDHVIQNNGTLEEFYQKIDDIVTIHV